MRERLITPQNHKEKTIMKRMYEQPTVEYITVAEEDVISTSGKGLSSPDSFGDPKQYSWDNDLT